ncbi:MAG: hypothetical protein J0I99_11770 [Devosia sp.]|uniref:DUF6949 family protein n=1 Tax=Devosia sp. TaxID=1871048 RepID=UPI001AD07882|nr:hypothetical protein [Devosia sp.]MBN9309966.1 hypothetical protein [Devosia sp.]MBN9316411.1 hypothetical protein [Devosia sp.]
MLRELMLAGLIMAVGLAVAGMGTHLYQGFARTQAMLRYDGTTFLQTLGHLAISFVCGPYIMLQMGWQHDRNGTLSITMALVAAFVAFGWAFITGLIFVGGYFAVAA